MKTKEHNDLKAQCKKMLRWTAASFVFTYDSHGMRCGAATKIAGSADRNLYDQCSWTAYRFFFELFRCPIGDIDITSADVGELEMRYGLMIKGEGNLDAD